jgi:threonine-phosphate decarboxylase
MVSNQDSANRKRQYDLLSETHGGYWRYDFVDHAYLYNLYFPPPRFFDLVQSNLRNLISSYPVAQHVLAKWVAQIIGQLPEHIVVGNGAAELIKIVSGHLAKRIIVPVPSFNEYANAAPDENVVEFALSAPSFELDVKAFAKAAKQCGADVAVVVSPNNPTSLLVPKSELLWLAKELLAQDCMLIVDESFIDFADDPEQVTLESHVQDHTNLSIFKSMSKAYGICGIRIGYMLTANQDFAQKVRSELPIWNLNGFAETFLEQASGYQQEFAASCQMVRNDRDEFFRLLSTIEGLRSYKPAANYVFCKVPDGGPSGPDLAQALFVHHNIYVKHCSGKTMPESDRYLRIASRTGRENVELIDALRDVIATTSTLASVGTSAMEEVVCQP